VVMTVDNGAALVDAIGAKVKQVREHLQ
jgi:hypothetical protein